MLRGADPHIESLSQTGLTNACNSALEPFSTRRSIVDRTMRKNGSKFHMMIIISCADAWPGRIRSTVLPADQGEKSREIMG
jgi:hypothetical protein